MFGRWLGWVASLLLAFFVGAGVGAPEKGETDSELQQKVQEHMDVIVDEAAAIVDDVAEEARKDERYQKAEEFVDDVREIADNTRADIEAHFGSEEETESLSEAEEAVTEAVTE